MRVGAELRGKLVGLVNNPDPTARCSCSYPRLVPCRGPSPTVPSCRAPHRRERRRAAHQPETGETWVFAPADWLEVAAYSKMLKRIQPDDPYVVQQLALATYKSEQPDRVTALQRAKEILLPLALKYPAMPNRRPLGRYHNVSGCNVDRADLDRAIAAYERGFYLRRDTSTALTSPSCSTPRDLLSTGDEAIADRVLAKRCRSTVLDICDALRRRGGLKPRCEFWVEATRSKRCSGRPRRGSPTPL